MTISTNEQVVGHKKVTVVSARPAGTGRRSAICECGWTSRTGRTEEVMPEVRTHLESVMAGKHR